MNIYQDLVGWPEREPLKIRDHITEEELEQINGLIPQCLTYNNVYTETIALLRAWQRIFDPRVDEVLKSVESLTAERIYERWMQKAKHDSKLKELWGVLVQIRTRYIQSIF